MSRVICVCNWEALQHYKDRDPTWIKLYRDLLTTESWVLGDDVSRLLQVASMLLAARYKNKIPLNFELIKRVANLGFDEAQFHSALDHLVATKFLEIQSADSSCKPVASTTLASCSTTSDALYLEKRREEKRREEKNRQDARACASENVSREAARNGNQAIGDREQFERIKTAYPKFAGRQDWINAQHYAMTIVDQGFATWPELLDVVQRYAAYIRAKGSEGTQFVTTPGRFFTGFDDDAYWRQSWDPPQAATNGKGLTRFDRVFGDGEPEFDEHGNAINF